MPRFAFIVEGPPVSVNTDNKAKLRKWRDKVRGVTREAWPFPRPPADSYSFEVSITNYYRTKKDRPNPPDVDNIVKPVLDGMKTVIFEDDNRVSEVTSNRVDLERGITGANADLTVAVGEFDEFLYIQVRWEEN